MQIDGARILIVGATGVLGGRVAHALASRGARLALTGRDADRLDSVARETGAVCTF
ncbi:MAG: KR domain-containing protein [Actinomycetota bacterium]|nr:KR domain-containing protein [Actinomycetota bacterium]